MRWVMIECVTVLEAQEGEVVKIVTSISLLLGYESISYGQASIGYESVQIGGKWAKFALFGINLKWCIEWWLNVWWYWKHRRRSC